MQASFASNGSNEQELVWNRVAAMFELTNRIVHEIMSSDEEESSLNGHHGRRKCLDDKETRVNRLKETAANYIHDKYCDWIYENGGWVGN